MCSEVQNITKRGLASAPEDTRKRVAKSGGDAPHESRGLQAADWQTRHEVARKGGFARGIERRKKLYQKEKVLQNPLSE